MSTDVDATQGGTAETESAEPRSANVSEREAREVAEAARETEWKRPSFAKELYLGHFDLSLIHPHPRGSADDTVRGEAAFGPRNRIFEESTGGMDEVRGWIAETCRRENLRDGGLGAEIHDRAAEHDISAEEAGLLVRSLLSAGVDTTVHALGNAIFCLATHPAQWAALHADPGRARAAFEEALRLESAVQTFFRTTTRDVAIEAATVPAGEKVLLFLAAANRDPRHWDDPDKFDIARKATSHLGLGTGIHACVGRALARLEGEVLLGVLARRVEAIELTGEPELKLNNTLRGFARLPARMIPA